MKYTNTPVTETYNQIGNVIFAIFLCFSTFIFKPRNSVITESTGTVAASVTCEISSIKYRVLQMPVPVKCVLNEPVTFHNNHLCTKYSARNTIETQNAPSINPLCTRIFFRRIARYAVIRRTVATALSVAFIAGKSAKSIYSTTPFNIPVNFRTAVESVPSKYPRIIPFSSIRIKRVLCSSGFS